MARIRVYHAGVTELVADLAATPPRAKADMVGVVRKNVNEGQLLEQQFAREMSGPHGKAYYKRITSEMTGLLSGEYGPHDGGTPVGAGWRHGPPNTDLARSLDVQGPKFAKDAGDIFDGLFW